MSAYSTAVLADSPVLYARLGEASGTSFADSSTNAATGTLTNLLSAYGVASLIAQDTANTAVTFVRGNSAIIKFPAIAAYAVGDTFTLECWIASTDTVDNSSMISLGNSNAYMRKTSTGAIALLKSGVAALGSTTQTYNDGTGHHVVWTKSGATNHLYVDGTDVTPTITNATMSGANLGIAIGADMNSSGAAQAAFCTATLDEVAVYATALSSARVTAHYNAATQAAGGATSGSAAGGVNFPTSILINS